MKTKAGNAVQLWCFDFALQTPELWIASSDNVSFNPESFVVWYSALNSSTVLHIDWINCLFADFQSALKATKQN